MGALKHLVTALNEIKQKQILSNLRNEFKMKPLSSVGIIVSIITQSILAYVAIQGIINHELPFVIPFVPALSFSVNLQPDNSSSNSLITYSAEVCNNGASSISEVRVYKNIEYADFSCLEKKGWELLYIPADSACFYVTSRERYIERGECEIFNFKARTPVSGCDFKWKFEGRSNSDRWLYVFDTTNVGLC